MPEFVRRERKERKGRRSSRDSSPKSFSRGRRDSEGGFRGRRDDDRGSKRNSRNRRDFEMTSVICSSCGVDCEVPFKPTSNKPVFCSECFEKKEKGSSGDYSERDLDVIHEKLNKIMKALKIK